SIVPRAEKCDLAELAGTDDLHRLLKMFRRTLHRPGLRHAHVFASRLHHLYALIHRDADWLFDVDILVLLTSFHHDVWMPVIGRGNAYDIDRFVREQVAEVTDLTGLSFGHIGSTIQVPIIKSQTTTGTKFGRLIEISRLSRHVTRLLRHAGTRDRTVDCRGTQWRDPCRQLPPDGRNSCVSLPTTGNKHFSVILQNPEAH